VSEEVRSAFIAKALGQGFDTSELVYVRHTSQASAGGAEEAASFPGGGVEPSAPGTPPPAAEPRAATAAEAIPATDYDRVATPVGEKQP
jgi:hypothetical protein